MSEPRRLARLAAVQEKMRRLARARRTLADAAVAVVVQEQADLGARLDRDGSDAEFLRPFVVQRLSKLRKQEAALAEVQCDADRDLRVASRRAKLASKLEQSARHAEARRRESNDLDAILEVALASRAQASRKARPG